MKNRRAPVRPIAVPLTLALLFAFLPAAAVPAQSPYLLASVIINELDADTESTDALEFIELYDGGAGNTPLDGYVVVFFNGSDDASYRAEDLDGYTTDANGYFVLGNAAVTGVDLVFPGNTLQNGADAVGLYVGDAADFPNGTLVTDVGLVDAIVYDTDDADDTGLLDVLLNAGQPQVNENGEGNKDYHSNQRCPNGAGGSRNTDTYIQTDPSPDGANNCVTAQLLINEVDADTEGTDALEFIELYDGGVGGTALDGYVVVFWNGSTDVAYEAFDLDGYVTDAGGYFVLGNAAVPGADLVFPGNALQNGADAVALHEGDAADFPDDTPLTDAGLVDAIVYDTDDADDPELLDTLLNPGQPQVNENGAGDKDFHSNQRCPNGEGGLRNTDHYTQLPPTPDGENTCAVPVSIFDIQYTLDPGGDSPFNGQKVITQGVVTAVFDAGAQVWIQDGEGPWNGINVYLPDVVPAVGDLLEVVADVSEYYGLTELVNGALAVLSSGEPVPDPSVVSTLDVNHEMWESVLVRVEDVTVTNPDLGYGEWEVDDGSGPVVVDDMGTYAYVPVLGDPLAYVQGPLNYTFGFFKIEPRDDGDIGLPPTYTPIYDIQYTEDPSGDSPFLGQTVTTQGVVTAVYEGSDAFFIQDGAGAWNGITVYLPGSGVEERDLIEVTGEVAEYNSLTELINGSLTVISYNEPLPDPSLVSTLDVNQEMWESVLVRVQYVTVTNPDLGYGEWEVDDGSGPAVVDDMGSYTYVPVLGDPLDFVQGPLNYGFGAFKIEPRNDGDIGIPAIPDVWINELDADTESTDALEFIELYDGGAGNTPLDGYVVVFFNGSDDASYRAEDLDGYTTDANGYFVLGNAAVVGVDLVFPGNTLQNGADAVGLYVGDGVDFPNGTPVTDVGLVDAIVYDTDDADDTGLLDVLLNAGQPQVNENGAGNKDFHSNQRCPNGAGGFRNTDTYIQTDPSPDGANNCPMAQLLINEVDADTEGTDALEFVELYDGGVGGTPLDGYVVVFWNGSTDVAYEAFDLDGYVTDAGGYFVLGNAAVSGVDLVFPGNALQNGADAVALHEGDAADFADDTPLTDAGLVDAIVYDTDDPDDPELLDVLLNEGQPQVNENGAGDKDFHSNQRCPNGQGGLRNTDHYTQLVPTPDGENICAIPVTIFEIQATADPGGDSPYVGQRVVTQGVVTAVFYGGDQVWIQDGYGPWNGINVYLPDAVPAVGDLIEIVADVEEYNGLTELTNGQLTVLSSGEPLPDPYVLSTLEVNAEEWESVLVRVENVTVTNPDLGYGEWEVDDGSGPVVVDDMGEYTYVPMLDDPLEYVQGPLNYTFGFFKIEPRDDDDIGAPAVFTPIYDIQYTEDPGGDSPYVGQTVFTGGVVTALYGSHCFIQDGVGAWNGLYLYSTCSGLSLGDLIEVTGEVSEYYNMTEIAYGDATVVSSGNPLPDPSILLTGEVSQEMWESVFLRVEDVVVSDPDLGYGEWEVDDGSGGAIVGDFGSYSYVPTLGDQLKFVQGPMEYSFGAFKIQPRDDGDILPEVDGPFLTKEAPANADVGATFVYSLTIENQMGFELVDVVVNDVVPLNVDFVMAMDGGELLPGDIVSWTIPYLPHTSSALVRFEVQVTGGIGDEIWNDDYQTWASNWLTPTLGTPLLTIIGDYAPIYQIQGDGFESPYTGQDVRTLGVVTGFFEGNTPDGGVWDGFYIQDVGGDGLPATSDAILVNHGTLPVTVSLDDLVYVTGLVQEFNDYGDPCPECETQIAVSDPGDVEVAGVSPQPDYVVLDPPGDPGDSAIYFESLEGMLTMLPDSGNVVGPTNYGTVTIVPSDEGVTRVLRGSPQEGMVIGVRPDERYGSGAPNLIVGSVVEAVNGPLAYTYGDYVVADQDGYVVTFEQPAPDEPQPWPAPGTDQFSVASFNAYNFDEPSGTRMTKLVSTIEALNGPTFLCLQEVAVDLVMTDLLANLPAYNYDYAYSHPDSRGFGVTVLWDQDRVTDVTWSEDYQTCSAYGAEEATWDPLWDYCQSMGMYPLFSRKPVVMTATVTTDNGPVPIIVIGNHLKSKLGGARSDQQRLEQAQFLAGLVDDFVAAGMENIIVLGDLNDYEDSAPLEALYASGNLTNTFYLLPPEERFSYNYQGVSQVLDHILVTPSLLDLLTDFDPLHYNADFPYYPFSDDPGVVWRASDHEPLAATFTRSPTMHVARIRIASANAAVYGLVTIRDQDRNRVEGATVNVRWTLPDGSPVIQTADTTANGRARFKVRAPMAGIYRICVSDVTKAGWVYDPGQNWRRCETLYVEP